MLCHIQFTTWENASLLSQNQIQSGHWGHSQVTLFTAHVWSMKSWRKAWSLFRIALTTLCTVCWFTLNIYSCIWRRSTLHLRLLLSSVTEEATSISFVWMKSRSGKVPQTISGMTVRPFLRLLGCIAVVLYTHQIWEFQRSSGQKSAMRREERGVETQREGKKCWWGVIQSRSVCPLLGTSGGGHLSSTWHYSWEVD